MWTIQGDNSVQLESKIPIFPRPIQGPPLMVTSLGKGGPIDFSICLNEDRSPSVRSYDTTRSSDTVVVAAAFKYDMSGVQNFRILVHDIFNTVIEKEIPHTSSIIVAKESTQCVVYFIAIPYPSVNLTHNQKAEFVSALTTIVEGVQKKTDEGLEFIKDMWTIQNNSFQLESKVPIYTRPTPPTAGNLTFGLMSGALLGPSDDIQKVTTPSTEETTIPAPVPNSSVDSQEISVLLETVHTAIFDTNTTIINTYFDTNGTNSRMPKMVQFVYDGRDIDVPLIVLNPPNLFGLAEITIGPAGREYRFRKDTNTSHMFNTMFQTL